MLLNFARTPPLTSANNESFKYLFDEENGIESVKLRKPNEQSFASAFQILPPLLLQMVIPFIEDNEGKEVNTKLRVCCGAEGWKRLEEEGDVLKGLTRSPFSSFVVILNQQTFFLFMFRVCLFLS